VRGWPISLVEVAFHGHFHLDLHDDQEDSMQITISPAEVEEVVEA
jgi:hypothetical protein